MLGNSRRLIAAVVALGACAFAGASCSSSNSPGVGSGGAGGGGGVSAGSGGAPAGTGGATSDSDSESDAAAPILPAPVLDPSGTYAGKTYAEWGAAFVKWQLELPGPDFPSLDSTGAACAVGQSGAADGGGDGGGTQTDVFFLAESWITTVTRSCTIPTGEMIFIPLMGWYWDNGGTPAGSQLTDDQLKSMLTQVDVAVTGLSLDIDEKSYGSKVSDFAAYLSGPTQFSYTMPNTPTNFAAEYPGSYSSATFSGTVPISFCTGYWILLAPLSVGGHKIHYTLLRNAIPSLGLGVFDTDVTYNLTVE